MPARMVRIGLVALAGGVLLAAAFLIYVYVASERYLADVEAGPGFVAAGREDAAFIEQGRHIARTRGCLGCHGRQLEGRVFSDEWAWVGRAVAPNLAQYARRHDAATIEAAVRQGIGHDGRALWSMPSYNFVLLRDEDMAALIAFLRSAPVVEKPLPNPSLGWEARFLMALGQAQHMAEWAGRMPPLQFDESVDSQLARGEYLAKTSCNECHGFDLRGQDFLNEESPPDLAIVAAYSDADFRRLMREGVGLGGREDLGLMTVVAGSRFAYLDEGELDDLLAYLRTLPGQPVDREAAWRTLR